MSISKETLLEMYKRMNQARKFEEKVSCLQEVWFMEQLTYL